MLNRETRPLRIWGMGRAGRVIQGQFRTITASRSRRTISGGFQFMQLSQGHWGGRTRKIQIISRTIARMTTNRTRDGTFPFGTLSSDRGPKSSSPASVSGLTGCFPAPRHKDTSLYAIQPGTARPCNRIFHNASATEKRLKTLTHNTCLRVYGKPLPSF